MILHRPSRDLPRSSEARSGNTLQNLRRKPREEVLSGLQPILQNGLLLGPQSQVVSSCHMPARTPAIRGFHVMAPGAAQGVPGSPRLYAFQGGALSCLVDVARRPSNGSYPWSSGPPGAPFCKPACPLALPFRGRFPQNERWTERTARSLQERALGQRGGHLRGRHPRSRRHQIGSRYQQEPLVGLPRGSGFIRGRPHERPEPGRRREERHGDLERRAASRADEVLLDRCQVVDSLAGLDLMAGLVARGAGA